MKCCKIKWNKAPLTTVGKTPCTLFASLCAILVILTIFLLAAYGTAPQSFFTKETRGDLLTPDSRISLCLNSARIEDRLRGAITNEHNKYRSFHYSNGSYGADTMKVTWDKDLAAAAGLLADHICLKGISRPVFKGNLSIGKYNSVGLNAFYEFTNDTEGMFVMSAMRSWFNEINLTASSDEFICKLSPKVSNYDQMIWPWSFRFGCGITASEVDRQGFRKLWMVCSYAPVANCTAMHMITLSDEVASNCSAGAVKGPSGLCEVTDEDLLWEHINSL